MDKKEWTPDMPLRADATDEQMIDRFRDIRDGLLGINGLYEPECTRKALAETAREFAKASVEAALDLVDDGWRDPPIVAEGR